MPELLTQSGAQLAIVRHQLGCPTLMAQSRTRWADACTALIDRGASTVQVRCVRNGGNAQRV